MARLDDDPVVPPRRRSPTPGPAASTRSKGQPGDGGGWLWLADPRSAVLLFLASALVIGGGRRLLQGARSRRAVAAIEGNDPAPADVEAVAEHGRAGLIDLFRLLGEGKSPEVRDAAGRALADLWARDELIPEEEKAVVRRGFAATWRARKRYPRALKAAIPIEVRYGVPFLVDEGFGVTPANLAWSHRILGAERAALEEPSPWREGPGSASFEVDPSDFATLGPHRLVLASRVRTVGLTSSWELDLPHVPFSFEFDPILSVDALLTSPDDARADAFARAIRLGTSNDPDAETHHFLDLTPGLVLRDPPDLVATAPLPCDLAHRLSVEFEGIPGRFPAGSVVASESGDSPRPTLRRFPIGPIAGLPPDAFERPGDLRIRAILSADPNLGWADPDVRSLWPGEIITDWTAVRSIRR